MRLAMLLFAVCITTEFSAIAAAPRLDAETAQRDLRILKRAITELHPGSDRYLRPDALEAEFEQAKVEVATGADLGTMYRLASRLSSSLRCGHTWTNPLNQGEAVKTAVFGAGDKLPLWLRLVDGRFLIMASSDPRIAGGTELLAIDGRPAPTLIDELMPYLRADGSSDGKRRAQLDSDDNGGAMDRLFPLLHPPRAGRYRLRLRDAAGRERTLVAAATSIEKRDRQLAKRGIKPRGSDWAFSVDGQGIAILTMPTFAFWRSKFDWQAAIANAFAVVDAGRVRGLVLDLRDNEGGDDDIGNAVMAQLLDQPYSKPVYTPYTRYERVPYALARFLDTWEFGYLDRTGQVTKLGERWYRADNRIEPPEIITPVAGARHVPTVALTGPQMSSAGFIIARDLKASGVAKLIGRSTGGNRRGLYGGELAWVTLPGSGVAVDIPLLAWRPAGDEPDAGIEPDIAVPEDFEAIRAGRDPDLEAARVWLDATPP